MEADALLPFVGLPLLFLVERAEMEILLVSAQHIAVDAGLLHDLVVFHQAVDALLQGIGIVELIAEICEELGDVSGE